MKVDILGTEYTIEYRSITEDPELDGIDGYHDSSVNLIVIAEMQREKNSKKDLKAYQKQVLRHEIIHAFYIKVDWITAPRFTEEHGRNQRKWLIGSQSKLQKSLKRSKTRTVYNVI